MSKEVVRLLRALSLVLQIVWDIEKVEQHSICCFEKLVWAGVKKGLKAVMQPDKAGQIHSGFKQMEEKSQSCENAWQAFIHGRASHARCKLCVPQPEAPNSLIY